MPIHPVTLTQVQRAGAASGGPPAAQTAGGLPGFGQALAGAVESLNQMQATSDQAIQKLAAGENVDLHQVMIAAEQTDIAFRIALSLRDKLVEAYQEVMRMQV